MTNKPIIKSKTVAGACAMLLAYFTTLLAGNHSGYNAAELLSSAGIVAGFVLTVYGRVVAKEPLDGILKSAIADLQAAPLMDEQSHE